MKIRLQNISKSYSNMKNSTSNLIINDTSLSLPSGDSLAITGPSGVGKSTLLNIISGLDNPDRGDIFFDDIYFSKLSFELKAKFRLEHMSIVFQSHNLLKDFNVIENIILPLRYKGLSKKESMKRAIDSLGHVDLIEQGTSSIATLSGGESQRVGIARAIAMKSKIILADEPTGNLDNKSSKSIMSYLVNVCKKNGITLIIVSHDSDILSFLDNTKKMSEGKIT